MRLSSSCLKQGGSSQATARAILIASADKDLLALVSARVEVHNTHAPARGIGPNEVREKLGVDPCQVSGLPVRS